MDSETKSIATQLGKNLRFHRMRARISQEGLGERASLHRTAIGLLERGERVARADTLIKLASALSIEPGELFAGIDWPPPVISEAGSSSDVWEDRQP